MKQVSAFGVTTSHVKNLLPSINKNVYQIDAPIGPSIVTWDIQQGKRLNFVHAHDHIVTSMERSPNHKLISTTCFGGCLKLWNNEWKEMSERLKVVDGTLSFSHWSPDGNYILTLSRSCGCLNLIKVDELTNGKFMMKIVATKSGNFGFATFTKSGNIFTIEQFFIDSKDISMATLVDTKFNLVKQVDVSTGEKTLLLATNEELSILACRYDKNDQKIILLNSENLKILTTINTNIKLKTVLFNGNHVYISNNSTTIQSYKLSGEFEKEYEIPKSSIRTLVWACKKEMIIWMVTDDGLKNFKLDSHEKTMKSVTFHTLTCCGVDFSEDGKFLVSGDIQGSVILWDIGTHHALKSIKMKSGIRSLRWKKNSNWVQIGCLNGLICNWNVNTEKTQKVLKCNTTIICMDWENGKEPVRLAIGTRDGQLIILEQLQDGDSFNKVMSKLVHPPIKGGENNGKFGTIGMYSEVWSLKWSPNNEFIATCSEDQSTKIWNLKGELIKTLTGHTTAVTSVDWRISSFGEILVTCADDKRVMIWEVSKWELQHEFNTYHVEGWHTLTYIALDKLGNQLITTTQNGYLIIWCLKSKNIIFQAKIHSGSIEGLKWNHNSNLIGTVSSDCTVHVFDLTNLISNI